MGQLSERLKDAQFYGILDSGYVSRADMYSKCSQLINAGTKIIQLRAKLQTHSQRREIALEILPLFQRECAPFFVINDDAELAASLPGAGLHIGQDDIPPAAARKIIGGGRVLGLSTHSIEQAKSADALNGILDYFAVGPVFATNTKPGRPAVGLELVSSVADFKPCLPWFAIGGINKSTARKVRSAGAERIVAVSDVLVPQDTTGAIRDLMAEFRGYRTDSAKI